MSNVIVWVLVGGAILLAMTSKDGLNVFNLPVAPGPSGQSGQFTNGRPPLPPYTPGGTPNSTLATVNGALVVANNALGLFDQLNQYFGSNADSEYAVPSSIPTDSTPVVSSPVPAPGDMAINMPSWQNQPQIFAPDYTQFNMQGI